MRQVHRLRLSPSLPEGLYPANKGILAQAWGLPPAVQPLLSRDKCSQDPASKGPRGGGGVGVEASLLPPVSLPTVGSFLQALS